MNYGPAVTFGFIALVLAISGLKVLPEYERAVIFRLGRLVAARGPGVIYVVPLLERMVRVTLRIVAMEVPPQDVITRDNVSIKVNAVLYFRVLDPNRAVVEIGDYLCHLTARPDHAARGVWLGRARRTTGGAGKVQHPHAGDPRCPD